jgi:nucleolar GTP-binding protein
MAFSVTKLVLQSICSVGIANIAKRERNKGAKQLDALMKEISVPLRTYTENFPKRRDLHPYERSLIELTFGEGYYEKVWL